MAHFAYHVYILQFGCNKVLNEWHNFWKKKKITENRLRQSSMHFEFSAQKWENAVSIID